MTKTVSIGFFIIEHRVLAVLGRSLLLVRWTDCFNSNVSYICLLYSLACRVHVGCNNN